MEKIQWKVDGMTCANCALTIRKYLEKEGMQDIKVNTIGGDVSFEIVGEQSKSDIAAGIRTLGYSVETGETTGDTPRKKWLSTHLERFWFCLPFAAVLMLHMIPGVHIHWLMNPLVQLALCLPVYIVGMSYFGRSAIKSLRNGMPNMNVLIAMGSTAAFIYSLYGLVAGKGEEFMYFETSATIFTLVFLGNYLEDASIASTQRELKKLAKSQKVMANMIAFDDQHQEHIFPVENTQLRVGDLVLIKNGEQVPMDCRILWGDARINESLITGESTPVSKTKKDQLVGGSVLVDGTVKAQVTAVGKDTVLAGILDLVRQAQGDKPPVQQLADKISAIFVPLVIGIALVTLGVNWYILGAFTPALMRSIAVLVIACPCAMGLATPAAIAVGLGRGARNGILFRNATSLELFKNIRQVVFDKTGTLTTGTFGISGFGVVAVPAPVPEPATPAGASAVVTTASPGEQEDQEEQFKRIAFSLEKYSNHPIAKCIAAEWKTNDAIQWKKIDEVKGLGMRAEDEEGNTYMAGSFKVARDYTTEDHHNVYITRNNVLLGWIDVADAIRPEAQSVVDYLHRQGIRTILLSGDHKKKAAALAAQLGIQEVIAEQTPEQKLEKIAALSQEAPTVMVGDGINDAPALAKATVGVSMSEASQIAMQTASVVLTSKGLQNLPLSLGLGRHTYLTIKQNLVWAFSYNIVAIPIAAIGLLGTYGPTYGALIMAMSDVVLAINSVRLFVKKVV